jgi:CBS-domain-containing membrane protein
MKKVLITVFCLIICVGLMSALRVSALEKTAADERGIKLLNELLNALSITDDEARLKAVVPLVHKSLLTPDGKDLDNDVKPFSYKKACQNVGFYKNPVKVKYVLKGNTMTVGFQETAENGRADRYFIEKKDGVPGMPAPIHIFWPTSGGEPKIINMGSF